MNSEQHQANVRRWGHLDAILTTQFALAERLKGNDGKPYGLEPQVHSITLYIHPLSKNGKILAMPLA